MTSDPSSSPWNPSHISAIPTAPVPAGYTLIAQPPEVEAYMRLRTTPGLSHRTRAQAEAGLQGAWFAAHVVHDASGHTVCMGRVIGDGGAYFHILDLATSEDHQRKGLAAAVLARLLNEIEARSPPHPHVSLFGDPPGRRLYQRFGFGLSAGYSDGMVRMVTGRKV